MAYLPIYNNTPGKISIRSNKPAIANENTITKRLLGLRQEYSWTTSGNGFMFKIIQDQSVLAIVELDEVTEPEQREHYLNLTRNILPVLRLAIANARTFQLLQNEISERTRLETNLRAAVEARDEFLSIASHELKTPLTALQLQLQLMARIANKEPVDTNRLTIMSLRGLEASKQLGRLLDELLDLTRIRAGKLDLEKKELDLKAIVSDGVAAVSEQTRLKGSHITLKAEHSVVGNWDPARINQIISNLLSNAIKYGEGKPIEVMVTADSERAKFIVKDHGMGIPHEMQTKIFERFERAVSAKKITGLGLGLYIVRQIVEAHGGSIRVESKPGLGSMFVVELPLKHK
jgi:signal transduction histidine kinase